MTKCAVHLYRQIPVAVAETDIGTKRHLRRCLTCNVLQGAPEKNIVDQNVSDYWLESGDYLNIQYLTVGYDIPMKGKVVKSLRVSASVNNLATITGYSGLTPLVNSYVVNGTMGIDDKRTYPVYRTYSLGLSIQF